MLTAMLLDVGGQTGTMEFPTAVAASAVETFISGELLAGLTGVNQVNDAGIPPTAPGAGADVEKKALIYYYDGDGTPRSLSIPAPNPASVVTESTDEGERVTSASGLAIAVAHATASGFNAVGVIFSSGLIVDRQ